MQMQMSYVHRTYNRLLMDISIMSEVPLGTPDVTDTWVYKDGPLLDKQLLDYIEGRSGFPEFPEWIQPLAEKFRITESPKLLGCLRNCLLFCYKVEKEPTNEQLESAIADFLQTDQELEESDRIIALEQSSNRYSGILVRAKSLISQVIAKCRWDDIIPSHGPGAVFPPCKPERKSDFSTLYESIVSRYPFDQYYCGMPSFWHDVMVVGDDRLHSSSDIVCKVTAVPKDSRGPRLICVHPKEAIWIQQGQRKVLEHAIMSHPLTRGNIKFKDQTLNGDIARSASIDREYLTLDLSEASDRISCSLAKILLGSAYDILSCARASHVLLPDGRVHCLRKWAPMGNALCFPVESLIFWALVRSALELTYGSNHGDVFVFGDDIICRSRYRDCVVKFLTFVGLKVNERKTFSTGFFRESCGVDAYKGFDVTPFRLRVDDITDMTSVVSLLDLAKRLRLRGYHHCASHIYSSVSKKIGRLPLVNNPDCQGIAEYVDYDLGKLMMYEPTLKWNRSLHYWVTPHRLVTTRQKGGSGYWYNLQDSLLHIARCEGDSRSLSYPVPYTALLTYGWTAALN